MKTLIGLLACLLVSAAIFYFGVPELIIGETMKFTNDRRPHIGSAWKQAAQNHMTQAKALKSLAQAKGQQAKTYSSLSELLTEVEKGQPIIISGENFNSITGDSVKARLNSTLTGWTMVSVAKDDSNIVLNFLNNNYYLLRSISMPLTALLPDSTAMEGGQQ